MNVTRNVVEDLLPLVQAGEASPDSKALVEEFLRANPDFEREVAQRASRADAILAATAPPLSPDLERTTLDKTRRFNRTRRIMLGFAIAFWVIPFLPVLDGSGFNGVLWAHNPLLALGLIVASTMLTIVDYIIGWRLRWKAARS